MVDYNEGNYYVFCVNFTGMILANYLRLNGKEVAYLDNDEKKWGKQIVGQTCISPTDAIKSIPCIIAANNPDSRVAIKKQLQGLGFEQILEVDEEWKKEWVYSFAPKMDDELYLKIFWYFRMGYELDIEHPKTFNEKIQWLKLHDRKAEYITLADKYEVKKWVSRELGVKYIIPTISVYNSFEEIRKEDLPDQFVLKTTHDSGGIRICRDKTNFDWDEARSFFQYCLNRDYFYCEREWSYKGILPRIIVEKLMVDGKNRDLLDYKFFCFNGEPHIIQVDIERTANHRRNFYTTDWDFLDISIGYPNAPECVIPKPDALDEMLNCARELSRNIPHVRVDLYFISGNIYFGEMTFYHGGGYEYFSPDSYAYTLGKMITAV